MRADKSHQRDRKQRVTHELEELGILTSYLAVFFCGVTTYGLLTGGTFHFSYYAYGTALLNAIVVAKVILLGEAVHAGRRYESTAVLYSATWKAFVFAWLVFAFHVVEEIIKGVVHRESVSGAVHGIGFQDLFIRSFLVFWTLIPLFVVRELRRVMGDANFRALFSHAA